VADFGLSRMIDTNHPNYDINSRQEMTLVGSPSWTAPEILKKRAYTVSADVYSFGIVMVCHTLVRSLVGWSIDRISLTHSLTHSHTLSLSHSGKCIVEVYRMKVKQRLRSCWKWPIKIRDHRFRVIARTTGVISWYNVGPPSRVTDLPSMRL
jgi:serine/threonine protein kinase